MQRDVSAAQIDLASRSWKGSVFEMADSGASIFQSVCERARPISAALARSGDASPDSRKHDQQRQKTLYERLRGYDAITAVADDAAPPPCRSTSSAAPRHIVGRTA